MTQPVNKPHVLVLGGNFAGLASAQYVRDFCGDNVDITLIERRDCLLSVTDTQAAGLGNRDPVDGLNRLLHSFLIRDSIAVIQVASDPHRQPKEL